MTAKIKPNIKVDAESVRKYSCLIDRAFPAMDGDLRRKWASHDAVAALLWGMEVEAVQDLGDGVMAINGGIWDGTYDDMAKMTAEGEFHTLRINSEGGLASVGVAVYNLVRDAGMRVEVDGMAFSAASVIASAGDPLVIRRGATFGIHRPWQLALGNYDDLREAADMSEAMSDAMFEVYSARVKGKRKLSEVRELYMKDSLLGGKEAVRLGLADEYEGDGKEDTAKAEIRAAVAAEQERPEAAETPKETWADIAVTARYR